MTKVLGAITGSNQQAKAAKNAANIQYQSTKEASQIQKDMYDQTRQDLSPYSQAGADALKQLMGGMGQDGQFMQSYTGQDIYNDPSYQFRLQQGQNAIQSGAAAQGGLLSGATQKALMNYGQEAASQEFQNAYNRFNADQTNQYNRLANLVGVGQNAAAQTGNAGLQTGQAIANNTMAGANAQAAGVVAAGNRQANTFNSLMQLAGVAGGVMI
jgi:hypothetical protein